MTGGIADCQSRNVPRSGDVLVEECGRDAQCVGNVVETIYLDVLRQNVLRIDIHTHQSFHRCGVLGAVQALDGHIAGLRTLGVGIERVLHPGNKCIHIRCWRLGVAWRRHQMSAQFAQSLFPGARVIRRGLEIQGVQREAADLGARVVAGGQQGVILIRYACGSCSPNPSRSLSHG